MLLYILARLLGTFEVSEFTMDLYNPLLNYPQIRYTLLGMSTEWEDF